MAYILMIVRGRLDRSGLGDKKIGYTTRYNAFWNDTNRPQNYSGFVSDGEGLDIDSLLKSKGHSLDSIVDWVNLMYYDNDPTAMNATKEDGL